MDRDELEVVRSPCDDGIVISIRDNVVQPGAIPNLRRARYQTRRSKLDLKKDSPRFVMDSLHYTMVLHCTPLFAHTLK